MVVKTGILAMVCLTGFFAVGLLLCGCHYDTKVKDRHKEAAVNHQLAENDVADDEDEEDEDDAGLAAEEKERRKKERALRQSIVPLLLTQAYVSALLPAPQRACKQLVFLQRIDTNPFSFLSISRDIRMVKTFSNISTTAIPCSAFSGITRCTRLASYLSLDCLLLDWRLRISYISFSPCVIKTPDSRMRRKSWSTEN
jgi:hypothetical protein